MAILYKEAREMLAQYAGRAGHCPSPDSVEVKWFLRKVFEYLLLSGSYGNLRKFVFQAVKGVITLPYELEVPLKVKIDNLVGSVWDRWFEYQSSKDLGDGCCLAEEAMFEDPNRFPTVYDIPYGGARVGVLATCDEDCDAHIIVQGMDGSGRQIFTTHKGEQINGEYLSIKKGTLRYTQVTFATITSILKTKTNGYTQLLWVCPEKNTRGFLADYSPLEEKPEYRRYRLKGTDCCPLTKVAILGRIRLKEAYSDNDFLPFDTVYTLELAAQAMNAQYNTDVQTATAKDATMVDMIRRENAYKQVNNGKPIEYLQELSPGQIMNVVGSNLRRWGRSW